MPRADSPILAPMLGLALALSAPSAHAAPWPTNGWPTATPAEMGMDENLLEDARDFTLSAGGGGNISRGGYQVMDWGNQSSRRELKSASKSIGVTLLAIAIDDGLMGLDDYADTHYAAVGTPPNSNIATGWLDDITVRQLATHTAGFEKSGGYIDISYEPGTTWLYSDGGANWLADLMTVEFGEDLDDVIDVRLLGPLGISGSHFDWRDHASRDDTIEGIKRREISSGMFVSADAMARFGYLWLRGGEWDGTQILPSWFVDEARTLDPSIVSATIEDPGDFPNATSHYGLLWWNNADGTMQNVPTDAYWAWGLHENLIVVIPSLDIVAVRGGSDSWRGGWDGDYSAIEPFIEPIALSVIGAVSVNPGMESSSWGTVKHRYRDGIAGP